MFLLLDPHPALRSSIEEIGEELGYSDARLEVISPLHRDGDDVSNLTTMYEKLTSGTREHVPLQRNESNFQKITENATKKMDWLMRGRKCWE